MTATRGSSLHICYVEAGYPHPHGGGGAGSYVQLVGRELVLRGHQVSVIASHCPECGEFREDQGIQIYRPQAKSHGHWYLSKIPIMRRFALALRYLESGWGQYRFVERLHCQKPVDLIEFSEGGDFWHGLKPSIPYVAHLHGSRYTFLKAAGDRMTSADWHQRKLELCFIRNTKTVVSPSRTLLELVESENGRTLRFGSVIPYPLDPCLIDSRPVGMESKHKTKIVMFAARNDPVKGGDIFLRAVPQVRQNYPNVEFRIFGYQSNMQSLPEGVTLYPFMPKNDLMAHYHQVDICVIPSYWDNSPNTVYEAMAAGKAVVASAVGGIPELVEHEESGLLVQPGNENALANAITRLLLDDELCQQMGQRGKERIMALADMESNIRERLELYARVMGQRESM